MVGKGLEQRMGGVMCEMSGRSNRRTGCHGVLTVEGKYQWGFGVGFWSGLRFWGGRESGSLVYRLLVRKAVDGMRDVCFCDRLLGCINVSRGR